MIKDLLVPFVAIAAAELGDKTQISILLLSCRINRHFQLLLGIMLSFLITDGIAILLGSWVVNLVPLNLIKIISGSAFIMIGLFLLREIFSKESEEEDEGALAGRSPFMSGFMVILLAEWGDKTQIAAALFAAEYNPWMVLAGTMSALLLLSASAVYLGKLLAGRLNRRITAIAGGTVFIIIGVSMFFV